VKVEGRGDKGKRDKTPGRCRKRNRGSNRREGGGRRKRKEIGEGKEITFK